MNTNQIDSGEGNVEEVAKDKVKNKIEKGELSLNPWESTDYKRRFDVKENEKNVSVSINNMLDTLEMGMLGKYKEVIIGFKQDKDILLMSKHAKASIHQKCQYLTAALENALAKYPCMDGISWEECCQQAVEVLADIPMCLKPLKMGRTVQRWLSEFRANGRKFMVPSVSYRHKHRKRYFLSSYIMGLDESLITTI